MNPYEVLEEQAKSERPVTQLRGCLFYLILAIMALYVLGSYNAPDPTQYPEAGGSGWFTTCIHKQGGVYCD